MVDLPASGIMDYIDLGQCLQLSFCLKPVYLHYFSGQILYDNNCHVLLNLSAQSLPAGGGEGLSSSCPVLQQQD